MRKIVFYVSGLGFGHLTRSLAIVGELVKRPGIHVTVKCCSAHVPMVLAALADKQAALSVQPFDAGFTIAFDSKTAAVDLAATLSNVQSWLHKLELGVETEIAACRGQGYELVLSDIVPEAFPVAAALGIPAIAISNYTWYEFLRDFVGEQQVSGLKTMYRQATAFLEYPLSTGDHMPVMDRTPVGLVARPQNQAIIAQLRQKYKRPGRLLLFLSVGGVMRLPKVALSPDIDYLYTRGIDLPAAANAIPVPADATDTQLYLAACDAVITKCGWSTVAEAMIAKKPLYLLRTGAGGLEERCMLRELADLGVSQVVESADELRLETGNFATIEQLSLAYNSIPIRYTNQVELIVDKVLSYFT